ALADQADRVPVRQELLEKLARQCQFFLGRLVRVRIGADRDGLAHVAGFLPLRQQRVYGIRLVEYFRLEVDPGGEVEIAVTRPRVTVDAAVLAAHIWVD